MHGCGIPTGEKVTCGQSRISSSDCEMMGCCVDSSTSACYYPMDVGETMIYLAEVQTVIQSLTLQYGVITTRDPLRFMVECRYSKAGVAPQSLTSVGYMVKTPSPSLPSAVLSHGLYAVDLRIAKDQTYSSYLHTKNRPLRLLLGNPVYLEMRLRSPKPDAVILVNYCVAYPCSARNALVLIYEGSISCALQKCV
ncbi:zona pellucida sperm-binding protein 1-like isoform X2 [Micropterus dolomieu]|uniref:zona pellucida sperm-binding protein 1-like isoform X2 n=1 Tax=Micropterus dolomieu TaxID=147949 RepID=UPI001E8E2946|nr:zona pellucida sperm-binding protein 1-like isoform X2 [Micropterus dolomieu]